MTGRTRRRGVRLESRAMPSEWLFLFAPGLRELLPFFPVHCFTSDRYRGTRYASGCFCLHRELRELLPCFPVHCFTCGLFSVWLQTHTPSSDYSPTTLAHTCAVIGYATVLPVVHSLLFQTHTRSSDYSPTLAHICAVICYASQSYLWLIFCLASDPHSKQQLLTHPRSYL